MLLILRLYLGLMIWRLLGLSVAGWIIQTEYIQPEKEPYSIRYTGRRLIVIPETANGKGMMQRLLQAGGLVNHLGEWTAGNTLVIHTGGFLKSDGVVDDAYQYLRELGQIASEDGGGVVLLASYSNVPEQWCNDCGNIVTKTPLAISINGILIGHRSLSEHLDLMGLEEVNRLADIPNDEQLAPDTVDGSNYCKGLGKMATLSASDYVILGYPRDTGLPTKISKRCAGRVVEIYGTKGCIFGCYPQMLAILPNRRYRHLEMKLIGYSLEYQLSPSPKIISKKFSSNLMLRIHQILLLDIYDDSNESHLWY